MGASSATHCHTVPHRLALQKSSVVPARRELVQPCLEKAVTAPTRAQRIEFCLFYDPSYDKIADVGRAGKRPRAEVSDSKTGART